MVTEKDIINEFLEFRSDYCTHQENLEYANSLDCALATLLECEKRGIDYPLSHERIKSAVQEPGDFWDACVKHADIKLGRPQTPGPGELIAIKAIAIDIGIKWLLEGFQDGL